MSRTSVGLGLFKCLVENQLPFSTLHDYELDETYFSVEENEINTYRFMREFVMSYGVNPDITTVARQLGSIDIFDGFPNEPIQYWVDGVRNRKRHNDIESCISLVRTHLTSNNIPEAVNTLGSGYLSARESFTNRRLASIRDVQREVLARHDEVQASPDIAGVPFGFPYIDAVSGGAQDGDYVVIVGSTGVGKTYMALNCGKSAHRNRKNVIVLSTELPNLQLARRVLAMEGRFSSEDLKKGRLSYFGRQRAEEILNSGLAFDNQYGNYFYLLPGGMFSKVEDFAVIVKELRPDLAIVDGAYLLQTSKRMQWWEKNMEVAMTLKNLCLTEGIPIIATYQYLNKDIGKLEGVGGGQAITQIASMVLSFEFERKEDIGNIQDVQYRILRLTKGRDGEYGSIRVRYNMRTTQLSQESRISGRMLEEELEQHEYRHEPDPEPYDEI